MICDVSDSLEVVTQLELLPKNVTEWNRIPLVDRPHRPSVPRPPPHVEPPPGWRGSLPRDILSRFESQVTAGWHDLAPGETRARLDYTGLVTFYDPTLSSLVDARQGMDRVHHRLEKISAADAAHVRAELHSVLTRKQGSGSSVDWRTITRVVVERYAGRVEYLRFLLSPNATLPSLTQLSKRSRSRAHLLVMLGPYITTVDVPPTTTTAVRIGQRELASAGGTSLCDDTDIAHSPGHAHAAGGADTRRCGKHAS
jgi:hypothetical protein